MELSRAKEELSSKASEIEKLKAQVKSLLEELHEARLQLAKLHYLDSLQQDVTRLKEQLADSLRHSESLNKDLKGSELKVLALEENLHEAQQRSKKTSRELDVSEKERELFKEQMVTLKRDIADMKGRHEEQVRNSVLLFLFFYFFGASFISVYVCDGFVILFSKPSQVE